MSDAPQTAPAPHPERMYFMVYHRNDWTLADAFRPQPGWGTRRFHVKAADLGEHDEAQLIAVARQQSPEGHRLTSVSARDPGQEEHTLWSVPSDPRFGRAAKAASGSRVRSEDDGAVTQQDEEAHGN